MAKPTGAIQVGGTSPPVLAYELDTMDGTSRANPSMHAYVIIRLPYCPSYLSDSGSGEVMGKLTHAIHCAAVDDQEIRVTYSVAHGAAVSASDVVTGASPESYGWEQADGIELRADEVYTKFGSEFLEHYAVIDVNLEWSTSGTAATSNVTGLYTEVQFGNDLENPAVAIARDTAADRVYAPDHSIDAYLGTMALCDTFNTYVRESVLRMCIPLFGNTAA